MLDISFELIGRGWVEATLSNGEKDVTINASYLSDAPNDLIIAVAVLLEGVKETTCSWQEEPGEYRWLLKREDDSVSIQVLLLKQSFSRQNNLSGQKIIVGQEDLDKFTQQIINEFDTIATKYTFNGYKNYWGYEFPINALNRLKVALSKLK